MSTDTDAPPRAEQPPRAAPARDDRIRVVAALVGLGAALLFLIAAIAIVTQDDSSDETATSDDDGWSGAAITPTRPRPDFTLTDTSGKPFNFAEETKGKLTMLFFGYTNCPDICPVQMANLSGALEMPGMPDATVVFVTTDPERDTPDQMRQWLDGFDPKIVGLTGSIEEIASAESAAGVANSAKDPQSDSDDYIVGHAAEIVAYTPDDEAHVVYPSGTRREHYAADLPRLMEQWGDS